MAPIIPYGSMSHSFAIFENIMPRIAEIFITQSLNKRLNTTGLTMAQLTIEAGKLGITS
jgi:hypothetical protein